LIPGWSCQTPYEEGVKKTVDWFRARLDSRSRTEIAPVTTQVLRTGHQ
jgi:dTDP-D-glucose 4,6-dehydratase